MITKNSKKYNVAANYSLGSSVFIVYLSSLIISYFIYGFISYQFRVLDFIGENAPVEHPLLFVLICVFVFVVLCFILFFDSRRISVITLHFFSALTLAFLFIKSNSGKWLEYENTFYVIAAILLLAIYFTWLISKIKLPKIAEFVKKYSFIIFVIFCIFYLLYFSYLAIERHNRFYSQLYDMGWERQVLHNLSATGMPYSTVESKEGIINWADHTSFIYYLLVPFYKLFPTVEFMLIFQALAVILAAVFIFLLANRVLKNKSYALAISVVFLLHPSVQGLLLEDFHPSVLALPLFFLLLLYAGKGNFSGLIVCSFLLSTVREEFIFFSFFAVLYLLMTKTIDFRNFLYVAVILFMVATMSAVIMNFSGKTAPDYARFHFLTNKFWGVISAVAVNPLFIFRQLFDADRLDFVLITGAPLLFLFFLHKPGWLLLMPAFLFTVFSKHVPHYLIGYHYSVMLVCAAFASSVFYLNEIRREKKYIVLLMAVLVFFMNYFYGNIFSKSLQLVNVDPELAIVRPDFVYKNWQGYYKSLKGKKDPDIMNFIKQLPAEAKVAADPFIAPHLSGRRYLYHIKNYEWADYIFDRKKNNIEYPGFSFIKETKLWKVYKRM